MVNGNIYLNINTAFETRGLELCVRVKESVIIHENEMKNTHRMEYNQVTKREESKQVSEWVRVEKKKNTEHYLKINLLLQQCTIISLDLDSMHILSVSCYHIACLGVLNIMMMMYLLLLSIK